MLTGDPPASVFLDSQLVKPSFNRTVQSPKAAVVTVDNTFQLSYSPTNVSETFSASPTRARARPRSAAANFARADYARSAESNPRILSPAPPPSRPLSASSYLGGRGSSIAAKLLQGFRARERAAVAESRDGIAFDDEFIKKLFFINSSEESSSISDL